ncbi:MAG: diaminopimelate epimerase [Chloroflexota bacterium]|nr:diaminopimelate epimerase [Chloroflexota bacterium]
MKFTKMHGAGNDYVYVNGYEHSDDWSVVSEKISDRHKGIGADGLIVAAPSDIADVRMRMFNADGSEGEMCGNGIRCLVSFAMSEGVISSNVNAVSVETGAGVLDVLPSYGENGMNGATVEMGEPVLKPSDIPVRLTDDSFPVIDYPLEIEGKRLLMSFVSMGNPQAIVFQEEDVSSFPLEELGPIVENHSIFPNKVNFEVVNVVSRNHLKVRVWERGSGITMACGTGACAVVVAARLKGLVEDQVNIELPGGVLGITWSGEGSVLMEGPVEEVFKGEWVPPKI